MTKNKILNACKEAGKFIKYTAGAALMALPLVYNVMNTSNVELDVSSRGIGSLESRVEESSRSGSSKFALIMTGKDSASMMRESIKEASDTLYSQGFPKENIFILDSNGNTNRNYRVDAPASKEAINYLLDKLPRFNGTNGSLVVYYDGHGGKTNGLSTLSLPGENLDQKELCDKLNEINPQKGLLFVDACYSGGFVEEMKSNQNYIAISSSNKDKPGYLFRGAHFLRRFNEAIAKNPEKNTGMQEAYEKMLRGVFPTCAVNNKNSWTNFPSMISNTNANWSLNGK